MTPSFVRGDEWFIGVAHLMEDDTPVSDPDSYAITAQIVWPGGTIDLTNSNGRISYGNGYWTFVLQEDATTEVPLGRVARMLVSVTAPGSVLLQASTPIEVRRN